MKYICPESFENSLCEIELPFDRYIFHQKEIYFSILYIVPPYLNICFSDYFRILYDAIFIFQIS
jgi:hypothetical protein